MIFNKHSELQGRHALFSPSQYSWLRYEPEQIEARVRNQYRTILGTELHEWVAQQIELSHKISAARNVVTGVENYIHTKYRNKDTGEVTGYGMTLLGQISTLPKEVFETAKQYVNDGIGYRMTVEQPLVYSDYFFGTADTIAFRDSLLRIHDFKSGDKPASMDQLQIYAALFCLEYIMKPVNIAIELRIYQSGEVGILRPEPNDISEIIDKIVSSNSMVEKIKHKEE